MSVIFAPALRRPLLGMALALAACLPAHEVTVGETQVGQGLLYQSSNPTYDKFFEETHTVQLAAIGALDDDGKARAPLEEAVGANKTTPEQLADLAKSHASKMAAGGPLHLTLTGLAREKADDAPGYVSATLTASDDAQVPASERDFVHGLEKTAKAEGEILGKYGALASRAHKLSARSSELSGSVGTDFREPGRRADVSDELAAAKLILDAAADRCAKVSAGAESFLKLLADAFPPPAAGEVAAKPDPPKGKTKKNSSKAAPKPKAESPKPEAPKPESPKPSPAPKPAAAAPTPASKPPPADDFNP
jgi:hypothetical protein